MLVPKGKEGRCQSSKKKTYDVMSFQTTTMLVYEIDLFFFDDKLLLKKKVKQTYKRVLL